MLSFPCDSHAYHILFVFSFFLLTFQSRVLAIVLLFLPYFLSCNIGSVTAFEKQQHRYDKQNRFEKDEVLLTLRNVLDEVSGRAESGFEFDNLQYILLSYMRIILLMTNRSRTFQQVSILALVYVIAF